MFQQSFHLLHLVSRVLQSIKMKDQHASFFRDMRGGVPKLTTSILQVFEIKVAHIAMHPAFFASRNLNILGTVFTVSNCE